MSRNIDLEKPLSDEDRAYLEQLNDHRSLDQNARFLADKAAAKKPVVEEKPPPAAPVVPPKP